ncbi:MAG: pyrroline-5-carboxylate reductase [Solirubrobacterales bacterium]|nr:pyrroline-5-carboxylate reductase [Solirubrobacterales bacterium]
MRVGLIGAGNMARALARGWREPVLVSDSGSGSGRASALAAELGGEALSNAQVAERADVVVLCHKPAQLHDVARDLAGEVRAVASILAITPTSALCDAYPGTPVFRLTPNTPVEVRRGVTVYAMPNGAAASELESDVLGLFERLGTVIRLPERLMDAAGAIVGVGPAYQALLVEAQVDAAVRYGLDARIASELVVGTMAGAAALIEARAYDTLAVRREVASPGGTTARGLEALERFGVRSAFQAAADAVGGSR